MPVAVEIEHTGHILDCLSGRGLDAQLLGELLVAFGAHEVHRIVIGEVEVVLVEQLVVNVRRLRRQNMIAKLELDAQVANVRFGLVLGLLAASERGKLRSVSVEDSFSIASGHRADQLIARTELLVVRMLVRPGRGQRVGQFCLQGSAQPEVLVLGSAVAGEIVADPAIEIVVVRGNAQRNFAVERHVGSTIEHIAAVNGFVPGTALER